MNKDDYAALREEMVQSQLIARGIIDTRVLDAFRRVPRHLFVGAGQEHLAYRDHPLSIGEEQTISQPYIVALMTQSLNLQGKEKVLEIGTGSGYQTAILAELAGHLYTMERLPSLSLQARQLLLELKYHNIHFRTGDGSKGWPEFAPFDCILAAAAADVLPAALPEQLSPGGRLVIPVGSGWRQDLYLYIKEERGLIRHSLGGCRFVPLVEDQ